MLAAQLETPALTLDLDLYERNIRTMQALLKGTHLALRPHYKSHKCADIARRQIADGAKGITCAKLGEAEDLAACGIGDILIANQIVDPGKIARLAFLAGRCRLTVCADDAQNLRALSAAAVSAGATLHILVEYEVGMRRCGAQTPEAFLRLAKLVRELPGLAFDGVQAYAGHLSHEEDFETRRREAREVEERLRALLAFLRGNGVEAREVSGASTGTAAFKGGDSVYTELQAGSYLFMDAAYRRLGLDFCNSLFLLSTVISVQGDRVVTDAGMKCCGVDQGPPVFERFPDAAVSMSEEHGAVTVPGHGCKIGDRLRYIPGHCCTTINLHDRVYLVRGGRVEGILPVTSRGKCL